MADGDCDEDLVKTLVAKSGEALEWVKSSFGCAVGGTAGIRPVPFVPQETIADRIMYLVDPADPEGTYGHGGKVWMDNAAKAVEDKGGKIVLNAEIVEFLTDENGVVNGVKCLDGSCYKADKGVICCTGGIDHNEVLAKQVNPHHYWMMKHHNLTMVDANTGEGILAGMALGAQTSFHGTDNNPSYFWIGTNKHMMDIIAVGPRGYRFAREDTTYGFWSRCLYNQTRQEGGFDGQVWIVFGDSNFDDNPALQDEAQVQAWYDDGTLVKGETVADTARVISCFADIMVIRHPKEGAAAVAAHYASIPVINAGDGGHQHPTQTLTDLLTIRNLQGRLDNFTIGLCGDLKFGRTVHSLINALVRYPNVHFIFISPKELRVPDYITEMLDARGISYEECIKIEDAIERLDILYMTRIQKERFFNEEDYVRLKNFYVLDREKLSLAKPTCYVLHPLPRVGEIAPDVDDDPRAAYFKQVQFGVYVRMAAILNLLNIEV